MKLLRLVSFLGKPQTITAATLISYYLDHDVVNMPKYGTLRPLLNSKKSTVFLEPKPDYWSYKSPVNSRYFWTCCSLWINLSKYFCSWQNSCHVKLSLLHQLEYSTPKRQSRSKWANAQFPQLSQWCQWGSA